AARLRLADAVRARVDLDGALQPGAGRDHLAVGVGGRCEEQHGEHRTLEHVHVSLLFRFVPATPLRRTPCSQAEVTAAAPASAASAGSALSAPAYPRGRLSRKT